MKYPFFSNAVLSIGLILAGLGALCSCPLLLAQAGAANSSLPPLSRQTAPAGASSVSDTAKSNNQAGTEAEDDDDVYRHSASVRMLGRWLHLDQEQAAESFEFLNFAILAGAILFFVRKEMPGALRGRRARIQKDLADARKATEEANVRLQAIEQQFARLDEKIAGIRAQAEQESAAEEARIKASMEAERQRIVTATGREIAAAAAAARRELKSFAARLTIERAAGKIALSREGDRFLIRQFVADNITRQPKAETRNGGPR